MMQHAHTEASIGLPPEYNICGVLVHINEAKSDDVCAALRGMPGVEIHHVAEGGRLVVTVEDTAESKAINSLTEIHTVPGVVAAALVYHHIEPDGESGPQNRE